ncbi:MAG: elongation factor G [Planctomycetaceae bacterium]|nr:elongation factor G [Planctomycetaceae bacterium]
MNTIQQIRNIGISAHIDSGKTTLTERMLYYCGRIHRMRDVKGDDGGATMDFDSIEARRGITISSAITQVQWNEHFINVIDTPGHVDFTIEVERSLRVLDGAVLVLCAVGGVQSQSITVDRQMHRYGVPRIAFINKMDRTGANPRRVLRQLREKLRCQPVLLQLPIGSESQFEGVVDLVTMEAVRFQGPDGARVERTTIPGEMLAEAESTRRELLDQLSLFDDDLAAVLLGGVEPDSQCLHTVIRRATLSRQLTPVLMGSAFRNKGVQEVLTAVTRYLPSPADRRVFAREICDMSEAQAQRNSSANSTATLSAVSVSDGLVELSATAVSAPLVAMAFKTVMQTFGQLTLLRIYQGQVRRGDSYVNARTRRSIRFNRLIRIHADQREEIQSAGPGDIIGVLGIDCASGDTFTDKSLQCSLESMFVPEPVVQLSIEVVRNDDQGKLAKALDAFRREDPTFRVSTDPETGQTLIAGMGQLHLDVYLEKLQRDYACECRTGRPRVAWRQCPTRPVHFHHIFKKMTGGPGQFGQIQGTMTPIPPDVANSFEFVDETRGGCIPREYIPAVKQGFIDELSRGPLGDFDVVGMRIVLTDGAYHENDSSDQSFRLCAAEAMRKAILPEADVRLLEPIMTVEVDVPAEFQGTVTGHLLRLRGHITASENHNDLCVMTADVPLAELFEYTSELRGMTRGQGTFTMAFSRYAMVPADVAARVLNPGRQ